MAKIQGIGVDIDGSLLKVVLASLQGTTLQIEQAHVHRISAATDELANGRESSEGNHHKPSRSFLDAYWQEVAEALEGISKQIKVKHKYAATSISHFSMINREMSFPMAMSDSEIEEALPIKFKSLLPEPLADMYYDYHIVEDAEVGKQVVLVAASKANLIPKLSALQLGGLEPVVVDIDGLMSFQHYQSLVKPSAIDGATLAFIDLRISAVNLYIFADHELVFSKEIDLAMPKSLVDQIFNGLRLEKIQAIYEHSSKDHDDEHNIVAVAKDYLDALVAQIETEFRLYQALQSGQKPSSIVAFGTGSVLPELSHVLADKFDVIGVTTNILQYIAIGHRLKEIEFAKSAGFYTAAAQLARRACQGAQLV